MRSLLVLVVALGVAVADVSHLGYHYDVPHTSYGVPSYPTSGNTQYNTGSHVYKGQTGSQQGVYQGNTGYHGQYQSANQGYQGATHGLHQSAQNQGYQQASNGYQGSTGGQYYDSGAHASLQQPSYQVSNTAQGGQGAYQYQSSYQTAHKYQEQYQQQAPQIFKHFYVHSAPEEPEVIKPRAPVNLPAPQKHYKIIVIKAPAPPAYPAPIVPIQPQQEEKTIVYVLLKKPEDLKEVVLPKIEQKPPTKPEVYFIKYKTKEESQAAINNIVDNYQKDSVTFSGSDVSGNEGTLSSVGAQVIESSSNVGEIANVQNDLTSQLASQTIFNEETGAHALNLGVVSSGSVSGGQDYSQVSSSGSSQKYESSTGSNVGYVNTASNDSGVSSSGVSYDVNSVATSQGIPHETYGPPKFRN